METVNTTSQDIENSIRKILQFLGEDPEREGLKDTPKRILKVWGETMKGYNKEKKPNVTTFLNGNDGIVYDEIIIDSGSYYSNCEHHFLPFFGKYWFAYIPHPKGKIIGLSKIARVVDYHSSRLQVQERLCSDIIEHIESELLCENKPLAIGIIMKGEHLCKSMRGIKMKGEMTTSVMKGLFKTEESAKKEFLSLCNF